MDPTISPKNVKRRPSGRRRAGSQAYYPAHELHELGVSAIRNFLRCHTCYDAFPVSFRLIVCDTKLTVKKALQCFLLNGILLFYKTPSPFYISFQASYLPPFGTARPLNSPECLPSSISFISSSTTTVPQTLSRLPQTLKPSVLNHFVVRLLFSPLKSTTSALRDRKRARRRPSPTNPRTSL